MARAPMRKALSSHITITLTLTPTYNTPGGRIFAAMADAKPIAMTTTQAQNTLPADFRNELYSALLSGSGIRSIEQTLSHELAASSFTANLKAYITHLLRSGTCSTFNEVIARVNDKIRHDTAAAKGDGATNGANGVNGHTKDAHDYDLALPRKAVVEGTRTVTAELEKICDITMDK
ncbi:hypothetical protein P280DRAFT_10708 [Massarina eburnea CBS 473.64]|uniref:Uncharacterized protein n=1 Tax=Massarina eburnea CBS 473.64 TaxID=1395130 RepID=A0A6A6SEU8_9PLEO|nr:hypothetical protein P280DRAFT_10708 [Massarina eburnea CBS 473.64]